MLEQDGRAIRKQLPLGGGGVIRVVGWMKVEVGRGTTPQALQALTQTEV